MEFKVGDRVRIIKNGEEGVICKIKSDLITSGNGIIEGYVDDFYDVFIDDCMVLTGLSKQELQLIEFNKYKTPEQRKIEQLEQRIEKLKKFSGMGKYATDRKENVSNFEKTTQKSNLLSEDEIVILRNLDKKWKWIARDAEDSLFVYDEKPEKYPARGIWRNGYDCTDICVFDHIYQFIKWKNNEPYNIEELLKGECEE